MHVCHAVLQVAGVMDGRSFRGIMGIEASTKKPTGNYSHNNDLSEIGYWSSHTDHLITLAI